VTKVIRRLAIVCLMSASTLPLIVLADGHSKAKLEQGEEVFETCAICHGVNAGGGEDFEAPKLAGQYDWYLTTQLKNFRDGARGTHEDDINGQIMQPMAEDLSDEEIDSVVAYIMTLDGTVPDD
ncbi:MAG: c-type cytochrome, partial [Pseudomonadota bacterium]